MVEQRCQFFREIELANVLIEDLIIKKFNQLKEDKNNDVLQKEYNTLKDMSHNLFDKNIRQEIFSFADIDWNV